MDKYFVRGRHFLVVRIAVFLSYGFICILQFLLHPKFHPEKLRTTKIQTKQKLFKNMQVCQLRNEGENYIRRFQADVQDFVQELEAGLYYLIRLPLEVTSVADEHGLNITENQTLDFYTLQPMYITQSPPNTL